MVILFLFLFYLQEKERKTLPPAVKGERMKRPVKSPFGSEEVSPSASSPSKKGIEVSREEAEEIKQWVKDVEKIVRDNRDVIKALFELLRVFINRISYYNLTESIYTRPEALEKIIGDEDE